MREELTKSEKLKLLDDAGFPGEPGNIPPDDTEEDEVRPKKQTQAGELLSLVESSNVTFFHDELKQPYAVIPIDGHAELWPINGSQFKVWLRRLCYNVTNKPIQGEALAQAIGVLEGKAIFDGEMKPLSVRVAQYDSNIWYDLSNEKWQAVRITPEGWQIINNPPILFTRYSHQAPQVEPIQGGDVTRILKHINIKRHKTLFLCWFIACFIPNIPHPIKNYLGEKGAAKTTASQFEKMLVDPSALETLTFPNDARCLAVNLQKNWLLPFDNVSYVSEETSDTLCRAVTGGGIQQRKLHTNDEDVIFKFMRCISINGINCALTRPDVLDRSILIELLRIEDTKRKPLSVVRADFEADRPYILGGAFDILSRAMKIHPTVKLPRLPRMADFDVWAYAIAEAIEPGLGKVFLSEYHENLETQNEEAINNDPVATLIVEFMKEHDYWEDTASALFSELTRIAQDHNINTRSKSFPSDPTRLSKRLNGIRSNLEAVGVTFERGHGRNRSISFNRQNIASLASQAPKPCNINEFEYDATPTLIDSNNHSVATASLQNPSVFNGYDTCDSNDAKITTFTSNLHRGRI